MKRCLLHRKGLSYGPPSFFLSLKFFFLILFTSSLLVSFGQQRTVTGHVVSGDSSLAGVTVHVKGTPVSTQTDENGKFNITASSGSILEFSSVGYSIAEEKVNNRSVINVELRNTNQQL